MPWEKIELGKSAEKPSIKTVSFGQKVIGINAAFTAGFAQPLGSVDIYRDDGGNLLSFSFREDGKGDLKIGVNKGGGWSFAARGLRAALGEKYPTGQKFELQAIDGKYIVDLSKPLGGASVEKLDEVEEVEKATPNAKD